MTKRGRPPFKPTPALRRRVATAAGAGMSHEDIALALCISRVTLVKHFAQELTVGSCQRRMEVAEAVFKAARNGNVAAAKAYGQMGSRPANPAAGEGGTGEVGKKELAQREGAVAQQGTEWESLLKPTASVQ